MGEDIEEKNQLLLSGLAQGFPGAVSSSSPASPRVETSGRGPLAGAAGGGVLAVVLFWRPGPQNTAARVREASLLAAPGGSEDICAAAAGPTASPPTAQRKAHQEGLCQGPGGRAPLLIRGYFYRPLKLRWDHITATSREGCMRVLPGLPGPLTC